MDILLYCRPFYTTSAPVSLRLPDSIPHNVRRPRSFLFSHGPHKRNEAYSTYQVVRIGLSGLSPQTHLALGRCIAEAAADLDRSCVLIASGDLSHKLASDGPYGYAPQGPVFDRMVTALFDAGDLSGLLEIDETFGEEAAECGLRSFWIMAGALEGLPISHELLSYFF